MAGGKGAYIYPFFDGFLWDDAVRRGLRLLHWQGTNVVTCVICRYGSDCHLVAESTNVYS